MAIAKNEGAQQFAGDVLGKGGAIAKPGRGGTKARRQQRGGAVFAGRRTKCRRGRANDDNRQRAAEPRRKSERLLPLAAAATQAEAQSASAREQEARQQAELQKEQADLQAQKDAVARQEAEAKAQQDAQAAAQAQQAAAQAQQAAAQAQQAAAQAEQEKEQLRASLLEQFNRILPTTDTPRGLKVNLGDVLFDTGKFELRPPAREALAKFSGIVIAHAGLRVAGERIYGCRRKRHAQRDTLGESAQTPVRAYLIRNQGIDPNSIMATGYGKADPVASNDTSQGRQQEPASRNCHFRGDHRYANWRIAASKLKLSNRNIDVAIGLQKG